MDSFCYDFFLCFQYPITGQFLREELLRLAGLPRQQTYIRLGDTIHLGNGGLWLLGDEDPVEDVYNIIPRQLLPILLPSLLDGILLVEAQRLPQLHLLL